ncbi:hypothetical protein RQP54_17815 [Curvibacter sp. APW13]|uniref:hypothetical protein n=1 Tax=Curvibacter sp. APW13 TaxID=3077236 RepID=UPI0028DE1902|nr:hypothetical protein [Curvibacter sp. APW13]MDT8992734.1 hypothetical protein [Curvibacter sp. APW13]
MESSTTKSTNEQLRELVEEAGLTQAQALAAFNDGLGPASYSMVTWKAFFASPDSKKHRKLKPALLAHAQAKIRPLKK